MSAALVLGALPGSLEIGTEFVHFYSDWWGSDDPGAILSRDRWRVEVVIDGYNGCGGYWIREIWKWDRSGAVSHVQPKTLSYEESRRLDAVYLASIAPPRMAEDAGGPR